MNYKISRCDLLILLLIFTTTLFALIAFSNRYVNHIEDMPPSPALTPTTMPTQSTSPTPTTVPSPIPTQEPVITEQTVISRGSEYHIRVTEDMLDSPMSMVATAYDLSYASCKKERSHPQYGITRSGVRAKEFHTVAVDPKVIPLGSILYIEFPEDYSYRNGVYVAEDVGSAIKGNRIDVFFGEDEIGEQTVHEECLEFGRRNVTVYLITGGEDG